MVNTVHAVLMRPDNHAQLVDLQELFYLIWSVAHDVVLFSGVTHSVWVHAELLFAAAEDLQEAFANPSLSRVGLDVFQGL